jgi:hypothetical protein
VETVTMPRAVGIRFTHASLQVLAEDSGVDLLHIKGPAVDESLLKVGFSRTDDPQGSVPGPMERRSIDADVLVRPTHLDALFAAMSKQGWSVAYRFEDGSAFEHAATCVHPFLAPVDVHRRFPGIDRDPDAAFQRLWVERSTTLIAGQACAVPSVTAQRLILILHAARGGRLNHTDIERCWTMATLEQRRAVIGLAHELGGDVALAAGTGRLEEYRGAPGYALWRALSTRESSLPKLWLARVRAAPNRRAALRIGVRLVVPNPGRMAAELGRPPTTRELAVAYLRGVRRAIHEVRRLRVGHRNRPRGSR